MPTKRLEDRLREAIRLRGYSIRTEKAYVSWYERYVRFHKLRYPSTMGAAHVEQFLIQKLMGHADIRTTQHYLEGQEPAHKRLHGPLSRNSSATPT